MATPEEGEESRARPGRLPTATSARPALRGVHEQRGGERSPDSTARAVAPCKDGGEGNEGPHDDREQPVAEGDPALGRRRELGAVPTGGPAAAGRGRLRERGGSADDDQEVHAHRRRAEKPGNRSGIVTWTV